MSSVISSFSSAIGESFLTSGSRGSSEKLFSSISGPARIRLYGKRKMSRNIKPVETEGL